MKLSRLALTNLMALSLLAVSLPAHASDLTGAEEAAGKDEVEMYEQNAPTPKVGEHRTNGALKGTAIGGGIGAILLNPFSIGIGAGVGGVVGALGDKYLNDQEKADARLLCKGNRVDAREFRNNFQPNSVACRVTNNSVSFRFFGYLHKGDDVNYSQDDFGFEISRSNENPNLFLVRSEAGTVLSHISRDAYQKISDELSQCKKVQRNNGNHLMGSLRNAIAILKESVPASTCLE